MAIDKITGVISWTPSNEENAQVTVEAINSIDTDTQTFTISVAPAFVAPAITSAPVTEATTGQPYTYDVEAVGNPAPTFSLVDSPPGMMIVKSTGVISWTPQAEEDVEVTVEAINDLAADSQRFTIQVMDQAVQPILSTQPLRTTSPSSYILRAIVNPQGIPTTVTFEYGTTSVNDSVVVATPQPIQGRSDTLITSIVTGLMEGETYLYRTVATNTSGLDSTSAVQSFTTYQSGYQIGANRSFSDYTDSTSYRLVSVPGSIDISPLETLDGTAGDDWRVFLDNGQASNYFELFDGGERFNFEPGRGFWVLSKSNWVIPNQEVNTVDLDQDGTYSIPIRNGWNIIGSVYDRQLPWDAVRAANPFLTETNLLWSYSGGFQAVDVMNPYEGYYFLNDLVTQTSLKLPYPGLADATLATAGEASVQQETQQLHFHFTTQDSIKTYAGLVFHPNAHPGYDRLDQPAVQRGASALSFMFTPSIDVTGTPLALDARPAIQSGDVFDAVLAASPDEPVQLVLEGLEAFREWEVSLIALATGEVTNLHSQQVHTLYPSSSQTKYRLVIGSSDFVEAKQRAVVPASFSLFPNYPNPFLTTTTIAYSLPEASGVQVRVYDVLGRQVTVLSEGLQPEGRHEVTWDGSNVPVGVYLVKVTTDRGLQAVRMVMKGQ